MQPHIRPSFSFPYDETKSQVSFFLKDGAASCIVASENFVHKHGLENQAIEVVAMHLTTDGPATFEGRSSMAVVGYEMSKTCANKVFEDAGFAPGEGRDQVGVIELHDCFSANEVYIHTPDFILGPTLTRTSFNCS